MTPYTVRKIPRQFAAADWKIDGPGLGEMDGLYADREHAESECERMNKEHGARNGEVKQ